MIRAYEKGDVFKLKIQKEQEKEAVFRECFETLSCCFTVVKNEAEHEGVLGVFGGQKNKEGTLDIFSLLGENIGFGLVEIMHFFFNKKDEIAQRYFVSKFRITVKANFFKAKKFAQMLGFLKVKNLEKFFQNENYQLYERGVEND